MKVKPNTMPRLALKLLGQRNATMYRAAEATEVAATAYAVATDPMRSNLPLPMRCAVAAGVWYFYSDFVDSMAYST
jgi:hypothetical protein